LSGGFLREATGLVREFGALDTIWINLGLVGIWFSLTFITSTATLSGGDPLTAGLIALVFMGLIGVAFSIVSVLTPRTAGDYVFTSRYLHPALGFVGNAGYFVATVPLFIGITITTIESFGLSPLFAYWGIVFNNPSYLAWSTTLLNPYWEYGVGSILTILFAMLPLFGYKLFKALSRIILPLILLSVAVMFVILALTPQATALPKLEGFASNSTLVSSVNTWGAANNNPAPSYSGWTNNLALQAVFVVGFSYIISAVYIAGEVKQVKKTMPVAILGTLLITLIIFAGATLLSYYSFGYGFLSNLYTLSIFYFKSPFPVVPYINFLTAAISGNVWVGSFIIIMTIIQLLWYQTNAVFVGGRLFLSYSFDRIMPGFFGDVSAKYHAPVKGMLACLVIGLLAGLVFVFPTTAGVAFLLSSAAIAIILLFPIVVVGIALFDYRWKHSAEYKGSAIANSWLGGWVYYLAAAVTIIYSLVIFYEYITVPVLFGFAGNEGLELIFVPIIVLFLIYYVSRAINARRGIHFDQIFKQLPPE
jgi:amino acid transporter